ncbi:hypothetical protein ASA1KI_44490 [Opitutales bacterium ASA1]|uniref:hypothetical protein n=1 Tax=Congregicoccus parvus TaxID=3081749 RepID=UPI002B2B2421|nr:hypothetical protein ASA1KI_44490 [Opitutales bacterium ASA1]
MNQMKILSLVAPIAVYTPLASAARLDFDSVPLGPIDGTGDLKYWVVTRPFWEGGSLTSSMLIRSESSGSANHVLGATERSLVTRASGPGFAFPAPTAPESVFELQFDLRVQLRYGDTFAWVGLGTDLNQDGIIAGEDEMRIGVSYYMGQFVLTSTSPDQHNVGRALGSPPGGFEENEWLRVRLVLEFEANDGDGIARLETMNLTRGETQFQPSTVGEVALEENRLPRLRERLWNGVFIGLDANSEVDDVELRSSGADGSAKVVNMSNRVFLAEGRVAIGGFVVTDGGSRRLLIRAIGNALEQFGIQERVSDPVVTLYNGGVEVRKILPPRTPNEGQELQAAYIETGAFPVLNGSDAEAIVVLSAGAYTYVVSSASGQSGEVLVETYIMPE